MKKANNNNSQTRQALALNKNASDKIPDSSNEQKIHLGEGRVEEAIEASLAAEISGQDRNANTPILSNEQKVFIGETLRPQQSKKGFPLLQAQGMLLYFMVNLPSLISMIFNFVKNSSAPAFGAHKAETMQKIRALSSNRDQTKEPSSQAWPPAHTLLPSSGPAAFLFKRQFFGGGVLNV